MANPFLIGDASSTFTDNNSTFNPFLTSASSELESHKDNPFFSTFSSTNSTQDNTNPFLAFTQNPEPAQPVADLLGINEKPQIAAVEDGSKVKPPPPRPAPPKRPPPRPTPPSHDAKDLILSVTGEMDATSLHLLDRLGKTPSPIPMRDLLTPSPTPTADLLGCEDLQPPISSQMSSVFDQHSNISNNSQGPKPERPQFPPKIDFLMDDLLEDVPIDEGIPTIEGSIQKRTPSIPENFPINNESKPTSRKSSNEFISPVRRLSHDVTESRKIMPDLSKIADRRKSDIGHFAPILPSRKPISQSDQSLQENKSDNIIHEIVEPEVKSKIEISNSIPENTLIAPEGDDVQKKEIILEPSTVIDTKLDEEKNELDYDSQQQVESSIKFEDNTSSVNIETPLCTESFPMDSIGNENISSRSFDENEAISSSEMFTTTTDGMVKQKSIDTYDAKPIPPVPDSSPFQDIQPQETAFDAVFEASEKITSSSFDVKESQQIDTVNSVVNTIPTEPFPTSTENDAFDAFAAKFDDSQVDCNASGGAFDAFGGISGGAFDDTTTGFGADDNFDSFLSTQQIPAAPQSTPAKVTRNNSGESLDENEFNVFIR